MGRPSFSLVLTLSLLAVAHPARADWTAAVYLGQAHTLSTTLSLRQPVRETDLTFARVRYRSESFILPLYYGYRVGYFFPRLRWAGVEGEFIHAKVLAETSDEVAVRGRRAGLPIDQTVRMDAVVQRFSITHGLNFVLANAVIRYPAAHEARPDRPRVRLLGRLGVGPTIPHAESTIDAASREQYQRGSLGVQYVGGAELRVAGAVHLLAEYKFTRTHQSVRVSDGEARTLLKTHHAAFGLAYHF